MDKENYKKPEVERVVLATGESVLSVCKFDGATSGASLLTDCLFHSGEECKDMGS